MPCTVFGFSFALFTSQLLRLWRRLWRPQRCPSGMTTPAFLAAGRKWSAQNEFHPLSSPGDATCAKSLYQFRVRQLPKGELRWLTQFRLRHKVLKRSDHEKTWRACCPCGNHRLGLNGTALRRKDSDAASG